MAGQAGTSVRIDGDPASDANLLHQALVNYGAYTSFRVEDGAARGLDLHLARLERAAVELFGQSPRDARLRGLMAEAVAGRTACWLRVSLFSPEIGHRAPSFIGQPSIMTVVSDPTVPLAGPVRVQAQVHAREAPHLKHVATFGLIRARRTAKAAGFDDALFVDPDGRIAEGAIWNIGFLRGDRVIWPQAPMLAGVGQALIERGLGVVGVASETRPVRLDNLADFEGAFLCNSATSACAIATIGDHAFATDAAMIDRLVAAVRSNPRQPI